MTPAEAHITIKNLTMAYGSFVIQHDLTFTILSAATSSSSWAAVDAARAPCCAI